MDLLHFRTFNHPHISQAKKTRVGEDAVSFNYSDTNRMLFIFVASPAVIPWSFKRLDLLLEASSQRP